jgi:hypothetical protein
LENPEPRFAEAKVNRGNGSKLSQSAISGTDAGVNWVGRTDWSAVLLFMAQAAEPALRAEGSPLLGCQGGDTGALTPGTRNEYHAGLQQVFGPHFVVSGEYIWKYTNNAHDFSVLGNTSITFPIQWDKSKIPGFALRANVTPIYGFSAYVVMSSVAARFFPPQVGGAGRLWGNPAIRSA